MNKKLVQAAVTVTILGAGAAVFAGLMFSRDAPATQPPEKLIPFVRVFEVRSEARTLTVESRGTVVPRTESQLVPEVAGRVVWISPSLAAGGFFRRGDALLRIEPADYAQAVAEARSRLASAELLLAREDAEADLAVREWESLHGDEEPPALTRREPQLASAKAGLEAARAALERAERDLARTTLRAPYDGRVREERVDLGQVIGPGAPIGRIYATDVAQVRLPIPDDELAFLDLALDFDEQREGPRGPRVVLTADFAGARHAWNGRIVRTEGEIDPLSRMVHAVAEVDDPYGASGPEGRPPLAVGMFVEAAIEGRRYEDVVSFPRAALRDDGRVLVLDEDDRIRFRTPDVLRAGDVDVVVREGVADGERIVLSPLAVVTDGMQVRVRDDEEA